MRTRATIATKEITASAVLALMIGLVIYLAYLVTTGIYQNLIG
jgi:hypothetical protein